MPYHRMSSKKNIVLLHGWGFDSIIMQQLAENLSTQFVVTVLDLPGYSKNHHLSFPDNILTLAHTVKDSIPECAIVIGWSLGGLLALQLALLRKDITKVIVIAGSPCFTSRPGWPGMVAEKFNYFFEQLLTDKKAALNLFIHLNTKDNGQNKCLRQMVNDDVENKTLERGLKILNETDLREELKNIQCPMQFIFAEHDQLVSSSLTEKLPLYSDRIEISNIKQAGHAVLHFNADAVAIEIERNICKQ